MNTPNRSTLLKGGRNLATIALLHLAIVACAPNSTRDEEISQREQAGEGQAVVARQDVIREVASPEQAAARTAVADSKQALAAHSPGLVMPPQPMLQNTENYAHLDENGVMVAAENPVSTFSVDVDTGSYANLRRFLNQGVLPPEDAVRIEEMINYFDYGYDTPRSRTQPFGFSTALTVAPWNPQRHLLRIGLKGYEIETGERPDANLVFLVDVSGSMHSPDKLELLKKSLGAMAGKLTARDRVSLVVYAGTSGVVLEPTPGNRVATIRNALNQLTAGGSTNGASGIQLAYDMARQGFIKDGINRVVLATDGDFNVGTVNFEQLIDMVERERASGITLTTLGFGQGNYNDHLMEQLANKGNGNHAYIDTMREANKVLVEEMSSTLMVIAADVKAQVEFNPAVVAEYRLIGYENRVLDREDFNNDKVDAGDIGAGHTVTALYELTLVGSDARQVDPLRYTASTGPDYGKGGIELPRSQELAYLKLRYKLPGESTSKLLQAVIEQDDIVDFDRVDDDFRFAVAVAAFGQKLRGSDHAELEFEDIRALAAGSRGQDPFGYRGEFLGLVSTAASLAGRHADNVAASDDALTRR
ncbi:MAG: VWA domain-containing protein [Gammaproteobacteria bacterium]|nr:VWA domain-containing protein [Gammaproteobacteria bacterium]